MADEATPPLLGSSDHRPSSKRSNSSKRSHRSRRSGSLSESTPLLSQQGQDDPPSYTGSPANGAPSPAAASLRSLQNESTKKTKGGTRWPTIISLSVLTVTAILILCLGFAAPTVVKEYTKEAIVFEPTNLSIHSFTTTGVKARVQGDFVLDASRVEKKSVRDLGIAGTWMVKEIEATPSDVEAYLPEYGNVLLGKAKLPNVKINIRNQHVNHIDFLIDLEPGDVDGIRQIANDWLEGRLTRLRVMGVANVVLKSGIFTLPQQKISESLLFEGQSLSALRAFCSEGDVLTIRLGQNLPSFPSFDISKLNFHEVKLPDEHRAMAADASVALMNSYPVRFDVPPLGFQILVPNCSPNEEYLLLADATTKKIKVLPKHLVDVDVSGVVRQLPDALTNACPGSKSSPLDSLIAKYLDGQETTVYVRGSDPPSPETPAWVTDLIRSVTVPLPLPGHPFGNLIRNFSLADVRLSLPAPEAEKGSPESKPRISAIVKAVVALPNEMNFPLDISQVRADADIFHQGSKLGRLDLHEWQDANATKIDDEYAGSALLVQSEVVKAPLDITNDDVFSKIVQKLLFGTEKVTLSVRANVDVQTSTALGEFVVREIPAQGKVFVKPFLGGGGISGLRPKVFDLQILNTTSESIALQAKINLTNPTVYSATIPHARINIANNGTILGHATVRNLDVVPGNNTNLIAEAIWDPKEAGGEKGGEVGRNLLSQYLSGKP